MCGFPGLLLLVLLGERDKLIMPMTMTMIIVVMMMMEGGCRVRRPWYLVASVAVVVVDIECAVVESGRGGWWFGSLGFKLGFGLGGWWFRFGFRFGLHGCRCRCSLRWQMNHAPRDGAAVEVFLLLEIHFPRRTTRVWSRKIDSRSLFGWVKGVFMGWIEKIMVRWI